MKEISPIVRILTAVACCLACAELLNADDETDTRPRRAVIRPSLVKLGPCQARQFNIILGPGMLAPASMPEKVNWSVNAIPGGNEKLGTIDAKGLYRAPKKVPSPLEIHICAEVKEAVNPYLFATVLMGKPVYKPIHSWTELEGTCPYMRDPHGIAVAPDGRLIIADRDVSKVSRCTIDGKLLHYFGKGEGEEPGCFASPRIVAIGPAGNIWIADRKEKGPCVQAFTREGNFIRAFAHAGSEPGQLTRVHGIGVGPQGRVFVADVDGSRINVYNSSGKFLYHWGQAGLKAGRFNAPHGVGLDPSGDVFVCNYYGPTQKFEANGNLLFDFAHGDPVNGPVHFHSLTTDKWGDVYIVVRGDGYGDNWPEEQRAKKVKVAKYNNNGDYIAGWHFAKREDRGSCAAVDENGNVYCAFQSDGHIGVQVFAPQ
jgi:streptogramin lyase